MLSIRDPVHGFIRADALEAALINSRPLQRLRSIRQLGLAHLVFPGAEHSRFSHVLGAMELAGRVYDALAAKSDGALPDHPRALERRLVRAAALLHDIGHAPFSHSAEELFEGGIDHEDMTRRLLLLPELRAIFAELGDGVDAEGISALLDGKGEGTGRILCQMISGELDVDKMDYLLRDSLFCGVRYGNFDLPRLLDTIIPIADEQGRWGVGVDAGGVHALEALVLARYYMFTQVYFNVTGKVLELHLSRYLSESGERWPADPEVFLEIDDISVTAAMRRSTSRHAGAVLQRRLRYPLAFETIEHLAEEDRLRFERLLPEIRNRFGTANLLESHSAKDPHRLARYPVLVRRFDGSTVPMEQASQFLRHLTRIDSYRIYSTPEIRADVAAAVADGWASGTTR